MAGRSGQLSLFDPTYEIGEEPRLYETPARLVVDTDDMACARDQPALVRAASYSQPRRRPSSINVRSAAAMTATSTR
jgi:hypothetical protein